MDALLVRIQGFNSGLQRTQDTHLYQFEISLAEAAQGKSKGVQNAYQDARILPPDRNSPNLNDVMLKPDRPRLDGRGHAASE